MKRNSEKVKENCQDPFQEVSPLLCFNEVNCKSMCRIQSPFTHSNGKVTRYHIEAPVSVQSKCKITITPQ